MDYLLIKNLSMLAGHYAWLDIAVIFFAQFAICFFPMIMVIIYFLSGRSQKNKYQRALVLLLFSLILAEVLYLIIGLVYHRPRPFLSYPTIHPLVDVMSSTQSFPSNHTILVFVFSLAILGANQVVGIIFLCLSFLVGLSRIMAGVHYPSDILAAIIIAILSTWLIKKIVRK